MAINQSFLMEFQKIKNLYVHLTHIFVILYQGHTKCNVYLYLVTNAN